MVQFAEKVSPELPSNCCLGFSMFLCCDSVPVGFGLLVPAKWLIGKIVFNMTYNVSNETLNHTVTN